MDFSGIDNLFVFETPGFSEDPLIDSESVEAIGTKVLMLKLRNSNTYIPQYETWAGANDGLVAEAALLRAPTQEISPSCRTLDMESYKYKAAPYNVSNCPILHTMLGRQLANTGVLPQCSRQQGWGWAGAGATLSLHFFPLC